MNKAKTYFWILLDVLIAAIILGGLFVALPIARRFGNFVPPASRSMSVAAEGKTTATPDLAESTFSVLSKGKNPEDLADGNNQKVSAVIGFLRLEGISDADIKTTGYNLSPDYKYDPQTERNFITGYTLTQTVSVKMRDFKKVPEIIGGLTPLGVNQIGGINFTVEDPERFLSVARADAFRKAQAKAGEMAAQNGVRLGRVLNIAESYGPTPIPYYSYGNSLRGLAAPAAVSEPTIEPGSEEVKDQVTITYELL